MLVAFTTVFVGCNKDEIDALQGDLDAANSTISLLRTQLADAGDTIRLNEAEIAAQAASIDSLNADLIAIGTRLEGSLADLGLSQEQLADIQAAHGSLQGLHADLAADLAAETAALASAQEALSAAQSASEIDAATIASLNEQIASLNSAIAALQVQLDGCLARVADLLAQLEMSSGVQLAWSPDFVDQIASFTQTATIEGGEASREVEVTAGAAVETPGATSTEVSYNGLASLEAAQAAITEVGTHTISKVTTTTIADGVSSIEYTANFDLGSHTVTSVLAGSSSSVSEDIEYVVAAEVVEEPADEVAPIITVLGRTASFSVDRVEGFTSPIEFRSHSTNSNEGVLMLNGEVFDVATQIVGLAAGTHNYVFSATDEAGNSSELTFTIEVAAVAPTYAAADYGSYGPDFVDQIADFVQTADLQNGGDVAPGTAAQITRNIVVTSSEVTQYYYGGDLNNINQSRIGSDLAAAQAAAQNLANSASVDVNVYSRIITTYTASEGLGSHDVEGSFGSIETFSPVVTTPDVDPADTVSAWSYSYVGGSDANWDAGEIDLAGNTLIEFISGVRTRVWTINGERDASTPSNLNASNQEVEHKQIRNTSYVDAITGTVTINAFSTASGFGFTGAAYTALSVTGPNGAVSLNGQSFDFDGAGTYTITFGITGGTMLTVDLVIDSADDAGAYNISGPAASISISKQ